MGWTRKRLWWFRGNIIMIVKMKFLAITGPRTDIDRVVSEYLSRYEIHLENALSELTTVESQSVQRVDQQGGRISEHVKVPDKQQT